MAEVKYYVQTSDEGFRSLHANSDIRQGETIMNIPQKTVPERDKYSIELFPGVHVDCSEEPIGATNHSCKANAAVRDGRLVAWQCIKAGDEITINYRLTESHLAAPFVCSCCNEKMEW
jgi:hypothetical protein